MVKLDRTRTLGQDWHALQYAAFEWFHHKILQKILSGSKNVRFSEFTALIEGFGFTFERISGSHHIYSHPVLTQPVSVQPDQNGQAKPYQLKQFVKLIEKYDLKLSDADD